MEKRERQEGITTGQAKGQTQRWQPLQPNLVRVNEAAFFDSVDHGWLMRMLAHRIADPRVLRLIERWLEAGVLESGQCRGELRRRAEIRRASRSAR